MAAGHLPQAGHARPDPQAVARRWFPEIDLIGWQRSGADQAHIATQHVEQLRQLVEVPAPQPAAHARDARVVAQLEDRPVRLVQLPERGQAVLRVHRHGAELVHGEHPAVPTHPLLATRTASTRYRGTASRRHEVAPRTSADRSPFVGPTGPLPSRKPSTWKPSCGARTIARHSSRASLLAPTMSMRLTIAPEVRRPRTIRRWSSRLTSTASVQPIHAVSTQDRWVGTLTRNAANTARTVPMATACTTITS